ncbi:hypothetical protein RT723_01840 [Psychrosphaera aquimarina]|uniref:Carboxypeptidase regulatory-like domain-containing protein n=1 Tax=Psychrosphaera aquimarina TaxID=2044854 RepID=A0ABU3QWH1_9GAMM|nr:hypothetical protein [Psychrosphaera aquimarina]MDU0111768.1 hypothetical protein [Psychrosphaera aquimarina]
MKKIILSIALASCLQACSNESKKLVETPAITVSAGGKVIDGYVSGATVFLDLNFDGLLTEGEPSTISTDRGDYSLELSQEHASCIGYVPIVVDIPVGAVDETEGEVTEAYNMVLPPSFTALTYDDLLNISPLTSVIWESVEHELNKVSESLSCESIHQNIELRENIQRLIESSVDDVVLHYNLSEERIFTDFVANDDDEAYEIAQEIVKGLKLSFTETAKLKELYPNAQFVKVRYFKFSSRDAGDDYPNAWYREESVFANDFWKTHLQKLNEDLSEAVRTIIYGERATFNNKEQTLDFSESFEFESRSGDESPYTCDIKESAQYTDIEGVEYGLTNLANGDANVFEDCVVTDFSDVITSRYLFFSYSENDIEFSTQVAIEKPELGFSTLSNWLNLKAQKDDLSVDELTAQLSILPYRYEDERSFNLEFLLFAVKSKRYDEGSDNIWIQKFNDGSYTKQVTFEDGTSTRYCSLDGDTWESCSE